MILGFLKKFFYKQDKKRYLAGMQDIFYFERSVLFRYVTFFFHSPCDIYYRCIEQACKDVNDIA